MNIEFKANQKQRQALGYLFDNQMTEIGYGGGAGGGKSYLGVFWQRAMRLKHPGTRGFFGRKELKNLKRTTLNTYYKFIEDYNIPENDRGTYNAQDNVIKYKNGSEILLLDLAYQPSDPLYTRFGSLELTDGFIDESNEVSEQCIIILSTRIGRQRNAEYNLKPKLLETFNPDKGHIYRRYYKPFKANDLPGHRVFIPALATDNPTIDPNYIEQLKKADKITKERLLYGNFDYDDNPLKLFEYHEVLDLFTNHPDKSDIRYISCDVARYGVDKTIIMIREGTEVIKIYQFQGIGIDETVAKIKEYEIEYKVRRSHIVIDQDGLGGGVVDYLRGAYGFTNNASCIQPNEAKFNDTLRLNYANLKTQCYYKLKELMQKGQIRVNAEQLQVDALCEELDSIILKDPDKDQKIRLESKEEIKERLGRSPDYADALMMGMLFKIKKLDYEPESEVFTVSYDSFLYNTGSNSDIGYGRDLGY